MEYVIYEDSPKYNFWIKLVPLVILLYIGVFVFQLSFIKREFIGISSIQYILFSIFALLIVGLTFASRLPRRYQIFGDRLKIVRWLPDTSVILFKDVDTAVEGSFGGVKRTYETFLLSGKNAITIKRRGWVDPFTFAPRNREEFLRRLNDALNEWKRKNPDSAVKSPPEDDPWTR